jgi:hypothetical protein
MEELVTVSTFGDIPLYKTANFEKEIKNMLKKELDKRQNDFKVNLQ